MTEHRPEVSVILPTYNRADLLPRAIDSILAQSFSGWELIIIDDGSDDQTRQVLASYRDPRIRTLFEAHSGLICKLRNLGIEQARGEWIAFLDSDDTWMPEKLATQVAALSATGAKYALSDAAVFEEGHPLHSGIYPDVPPHKPNLSGRFFPKIVRGIWPVYPTTLIFQKSCLDQTGELPEEFYVSGEYEFICRLAYQFEGVLCNQPLAEIHRSRGSISNLREELAYQEALNILQKLHEDRLLSRSDYRQTAARFYLQLGTVQQKQGRSREAAKQFWKAWQSRPTNAKNLIRAGMAISKRIGD